MGLDHTEVWAVRSETGSTVGPIIMHFRLWTGKLTFSNKSLAGCTTTVPDVSKRTVTQKE